METLHPRIRILWLLQAAIASAVLGVIVGVFDHYLTDYGLVLPIAAFLLLFLITGTHSLLRYRIWRYEVRDDELFLRRGVFTRVKTLVPYVRIQHVDSRRSPLERLTGLASTVVYTAGSRGADVTIPGLTPDQAEDLQRQLKELSAEAEGDDAV